MTRKRNLVGLAAASLLILAAAGQPALAASGSSGHTLGGNTPAWVTKATKLGATSPSKSIDLTVWLKLRNEAGLQALLRQQYTPGSSGYHHWLTARQFNAAYAPTAGQVAAVTRYLKSAGFKVNAVAANRSYVNVSGSVAQAQKAFAVHINDYRYHGATYRSNSGNPTISDAAGSYIATIAGLNNASDFAPLARKATNPQTAVAWDVQCGGFNTTKTVNYTDGTSQTLHGFIPCGYDGDQLQKAYGVDTLVNQGIDGTGETVAIVDAYGSPTILQDANAFSAKAGLPPLTSQNFQVVTPNGITNKKESPAQDPLGWQAEVSLDVEAVHAMAPGAKIVLVAAPNNYASLDEAVNWVVNRHLADIVTNSWGLSTDLMAPGQASRDERIFMQAAAMGVGLNFSSGDSGDELANTGTKSVDFPASSPWVNAVGGTSLFTNDDGSYDFETGWGNDLTRLATCATSSTDPATGLLECNTYNKAGLLDEGFTGGAGGGLSYNFTAQPWQSSAIGGDTASGFGTVGTHRAVPDVGMLADPYTGMNVYITDLSAGDTSPEVEVYGGTSLASPLFAGVMALVDQARAQAGKAPAGLASQYVYNLPSAALHDVTAPPTGVGNPVLGDPSSMGLFYGSRYSGSLFNVTFNEDSSLTTTTGWDDVTGVGTPNVPAFVSALAAE